MSSASVSAAEHPVGPRRTTPADASETDRFSVMAQARVAAPAAATPWRIVGYSGCQPSSTRAFGVGERQAHRDHPGHERRNETRQPQRGVRSARGAPAASAIACAIRAEAHRLVVDDVVGAAGGAAPPGPATVARAASSTWMHGSRLRSPRIRGEHAATRHGQHLDRRRGSRDRRNIP